MENVTNKTRRNILGIGLAAPAFFLMSCSKRGTIEEPILVDVSDVKDMPSLILAMKNAARKLLPNSIKDDEFCSGFASTFVEYAHAAKDNGYPIPQWVLNKLPKRKVVFPLLGVITFPIWGVYFTIAVGAIIKAVLVSIILMTVFISQAIYLVFKSPEKT